MNPIMKTIPHSLLIRLALSLHGLALQAADTEPKLSKEMTLKLLKSRVLLMLGGGAMILDELQISAAK
jgi:hypothetical protein